MSKQRIGGSLAAMRIWTAWLLMLLTFPAIAGGWRGYENARFGYAVDVPSGFEWGPEAENGNGRIFTSADGTRTIRAYGGHVLDESFEAAATRATAYAREAGWRVGDERITPSWASYSARRNGLIRQVRMISLCGGSRYAAVAIDFPERDVRAIEPVAGQVTGSLRGTGNCS